MMASKTYVLLLLLFLSCNCINALPEEDRIVNLPLYGPPPTPQYSGYLDATSGCNTSINGEYCKIHYWLTVAQGDDWQSKPVILWLNGGPGSSSILGLLQENGPLLINATGGLMDNPYSWNTIANLFVIESPIGVGYSYCAAQKEDGKVCQNTDKYTASAAKAAMVDFFINKFPEFQNNDFFITGESYAGVYIPTLAYEILQYNAVNPSHAINLKGLAVGDPCTDNTSQEISMDALWYGHKYGLVDDAVFDQLWNHCNVRISNRLMKNNYINNMKLSENNNNNITMIEYIESFINSNQKMHDTKECKLALRKFLLSTSRALSQGWKDLFIDDYSLFAPVTNLEDEYMVKYMRRPDVKAALHVEETPIEKWPYPSIGFDYTKEYDACNEDADDDALSMIDFYRKIVPKLNVVYVYNGDTDPCVSYEGTRIAIKRIGFPEMNGGGYRPWFYNHTATTIQVLQEKSTMFGPDLLLQNTGAQFGGEIVNYENNLAFLTIHGSGHMVPQFRPQAALHMINKLIRYEQLTPLLASNETLYSMNNNEFDIYMNEWTEFAKTLPNIPN